MKGPEGYLYLVLTLRWLFPPTRSLSPCCRSSPCVLVAPMAGACEDEEPVGRLPSCRAWAVRWGADGSQRMSQGWKPEKGKALNFCGLLTSQAGFRLILREILASLPPGSSSDPPLLSHGVTGAQKQIFMGFRSHGGHPGQTTTTVSSGGREKLALGEMVEPPGKKGPSEGPFSSHHWKHLNHWTSVKWNQPPLNNVF